MLKNGNITTVIRKTIKIKEVPQRGCKREEEFENYFKDFLRPQLVEMLF